MSEKGSIPDTASARLITKVVLTYRLESDPAGTERTMVLEHGGGGEVVDAIVWSDELMKKLAYLENSECVEPKKEPGRGDWKVYAAGQEKAETDESAKSTFTGTRALSEAEIAADTSAAGEAECVWVHQVTCDWAKYCPPTVR